MTITTITKVCVAILLLAAVSSCAEDPLEKTTGEGGHTITLRLSATMTPIPETKATALLTRSDSEAEAAGFKYEMLSSDADQAATAPGFGIEAMPAEEENSDVHFKTKALATKAPGTLKNAYALLFTSAGAFNGRAVIGTYTVGTPQDVTFTNVVSPTATGCRLVIVANDNAAATTYASNAGTGGFAGFTGTYADFQKLILSSTVNQDIDVPYAGSATVNLSQSEMGTTIAVSLSWMLAKVTLNNTFNITGGPARGTIILYNAGERRFATPGNDDYNGTGTTLTTAFVASTVGSNTNSVTWYVGENIRPSGSGISSGSDRNGNKAPANACYIRIGSATQSITGNTNPSIGQEYTTSGTKSFTYDIYLGKSSVISDFSLRRHTNYTISSEISGTLAAQEQLAAQDGRVILTKTGFESAGLAVGRFGGASGYTTGMYDVPPTVAGSYTKLLLLEPNTTRTTATDNVSRQWSNTSTQWQPQTRKYWDHTYTSAYIDKAAGLAFDYCYNLTLGGVAKGTWYLPTQAQVLMMWSVVRGMQGNGSFANYSAFLANRYWSSTENGSYVWRVDFSNGDGNGLSDRTKVYMVRCVRDA